MRQFSSNKLFFFLLAKASHGFTTNVAGPAILISGNHESRSSTSRYLETSDEGDFAPSQDPVLEEVDVAIIGAGLGGTSR